MYKKDLMYFILSCKRLVHFNLGSEKVVSILQVKRGKHFEKKIIIELQLLCKNSLTMFAKF